MAEKLHKNANDPQVPCLSDLANDGEVTGAILKTPNGAQHDRDRDYTGTISEGFRGGLGAIGNFCDENPTPRKKPFGGNRTGE